MMNSSLRARGSRASVQADVQMGSSRTRRILAASRRDRRFLGLSRDFRGTRIQAGAKGAAEIPAFLLAAGSPNRSAKASRRMCPWLRWIRPANVVILANCAGYEQLRASRNSRTNQLSRRRRTYAAPAIVALAGSARATQPASAYSGCGRATMVGRRPGTAPTDSLTPGANTRPGSGWASRTCRACGQTCLGASSPKSGKYRSTSSSPLTTVAGGSPPPRNLAIFFCVGQPVPRSYWNLSFGIRRLRRVGTRESLVQFRFVEDPRRPSPSRDKCSEAAQCSA